MVHFYKNLFDNIKPVFLVSVVTFQCFFLKKIVLIKISEKNNKSLQFSFLLFLIRYFYDTMKDFQI